MNSVLRITVRFLQPLAHGRKDGGEPEWPPSPLRLFQSLVAAAAARWNERMCLDYAVPALGWLERLCQPDIVSVSGSVSDTPYLLYIPHNAADQLVPAWKQGDLAKAVKREQKPVRPTHLSGEAVHYLYPMPDGGCPHEEVLKAAARSVTHLGWGIDMVAADAKLIPQDEADRLPGHRWQVVESGGVSLRVPRAGTLANLMEKHAAFLGRLSADGFRPVPPLSCFDVKQYYSPTAAVGKHPERPLAAFEIHRTIDDQEQNPGKSRFRPFHHVRRVATVAGMVRHAAATVARQVGHPAAWVDEHICGHGNGKSGQSTSDERLMFLPLPSLQPVVGVGGIRRVLIVGWPGFAKLADLRRRLNGCELISQETNEAVAVLSQLATSDKSVMPYTNPSRSWSTVTPVVLPGFDDPDGLRRKLRQRDGKTAAEQQRLLERLHQRTMNLLFSAFQAAGWSTDVLKGTEVEYRKVGWFRGLDLANYYDLPPLKYPRYHVRVRFPQPIAGPLVIGAGRYRGFGLFAAES